MKDANAYIKRIEEKIGQRIQPKRLRNCVIWELERAYGETESLTQRVCAVLTGSMTYDPKEQKTIKLSDREK